jgi:uncharacterized protein (DUF2249 family)
MPETDALPHELDVRSLPRPLRHEAIMAVFGQLGPGRSFELVNDHDPLGLFQRMQEAMPGNFTWEYVARGPQEWRVAIGRPNTSGCCGSCG